MQGGLKEAPILSIDRFVNQLLIATFSAASRIPEVHAMVLASVLLPRDGVSGEV